MNRHDRRLPMSGEAVIEYLDSDFRVIKPGAFVRCGVTGEPIAVEDLKYWSVESQEAFATPQAALQRVVEQRRRTGRPVSGGR